DSSCGRARRNAAGYSSRLHVLVRRGLVHKVFILKTAAKTQRIVDSKIGSCFISSSLRLRPIGLALRGGFALSGSRFARKKSPMKQPPILEFTIGFFCTLCAFLWPTFPEIRKCLADP